MKRKAKEDRTLLNISVLTYQWSQHSPVVMKAERNTVLHLPFFPPPFVVRPANSTQPQVLGERVRVTDTNRTVEEFVCTTFNACSLVVVYPCIALLSRKCLRRTLVFSLDGLHSAYTA